MDWFSSISEEEEDSIDYDDSGFNEDLTGGENAVTKDNDSAPNNNYLHVRKAKSHSGFAPMEAIADEDDSAIINEGSPLLMPEDAHNQRSYSGGRSRSSASVPRGESVDQDLKRMPSPIGLGPGIGGRSRRYSSEIGSSRSGWGAGGTSYH